MLTKTLIARLTKAGAEITQDENCSSRYYATKGEQLVQWWDQEGSAICVSPPAPTPTS